MCVLIAKLLQKVYSALPVYERSLSMESPVDLTLGSAHTASSSYTNATNTVNGLKSSLSFVGDHLERIRKIEEYLQALEDERRKIEAFKRELPLCMQLLEESK